MACRLTLIISVLTLMNFVLAGKYMVYPWDRKDMRTNNMVTKALDSLLGEADVRVVGDQSREIIDFWLISCTETDADSIRNWLKPGQTFNLPANKKFKGWLDFKRKPYVYDKRKLTDTWIYVIDDGIDPKSADFAHLAVDDIEWLFAPDAKTDKTDDDPDYHGSCVASKAMGFKNGVSKSSRLVIVKATTVIHDVSWAFSQIAKDIRDKNRQDKAAVVLPMTSKQSFLNNPRQWIWEWRAMLMNVHDLIEEQAFVVVAAGNFASRSKEIDTLPALFTSVASYHFFYVVSAVSMSGFPLSDTQRDVDAIWAPGEVTCAGRKGSQSESGSSFSAPMVAGLTAYLVGLGTPILKIRDTIVKAERPIHPRKTPRVIWNGLNGDTGSVRTTPSTPILQLFENSTNATGERAQE
ncbi:hypothetical protein ACLMJK_005663 [Lecanora helva]